MNDNHLPGVMLTYRRAVNGAKQRNAEFRRLFAAVRRSLPWIEKADLPAVASWVELELICNAAFDALSETGLLRTDSEARDGDVKQLANTYQAMRKTQLAYSRELGMTPAARMAIKLTGTRVALDLAAQLANPDVEDAEEV